MCYIDFDESCEVWLHSERRARKPHQCVVCLRVIYVGERYTIHFSVMDLVPCCEKVCSFCQAGRLQFKEAHEGMEYTPGYFRQALVDCITEEEESAQTWRPILDEIDGRRASRVA